MRRKNYNSTCMYNVRRTLYVYVYVGTARHNKYVFHNHLLTHLVRVSVAVKWTMSIRNKHTTRDTTSLYCVTVYTYTSPVCTRTTGYVERRTSAYIINCTTERVQRRCKYRLPSGYIVTPLGILFAFLTDHLFAALVIKVNAKSSTNILRISNLVNSYSTIEPVAKFH